MTNKLYLPNGYIDWGYITNIKAPFIFVTGGRGTGKTYGILKWLFENKQKFIYMRRTRMEIELILTAPESNPYDEINRKEGANLYPIKYGKYLGALAPGEITEDGFTQSGGITALMVSLSTIATMRGLASGLIREAEYIFYDEFIPEPHAKPIKEEAYALLNAYETFNRNRELEGLPSMRLIACSNSNKLDNPIYMGLGLVSKVDAMKKRKQQISVLQDRGIALINLEDSPISERKADTALYKAAAGTKFGEMALENKYVGAEYRGNITSVPLSECVAVCGIGEICIYKHKNKGYYVCQHFSGSPRIYDAGDTGKKQFKYREAPLIYKAFLRGDVKFDTYLTECLFTKYLQ